jgi:hypothetical protein
MSAGASASGLTPVAMLLALCAAAACQNFSPQDDEPAVLVNPSPEARAELGRVLREALGQRDLLLAPDALTATSVLALEPAARGDLERPSPTGRLLGRPETFRLVINDGACYLIRTETNERWPLEHSTCRPAAG